MQDDELWQRWKAMDADTRDAEARLRGAWALYDKYGLLPPEDLVIDVSRLREASDRALSELVASLTPFTSTSDWDERDTDAEPA